MKCVVCQKEFQSNFCPCCGFPVVESTDVDGLYHAMQQHITEYRRDFERKLCLGVFCYTWKETEGRIVQDQRERLTFGAYSALRGRTTWLTNRFARIPDVAMLEVNACVTNNDRTSERIVSVSNLLTPSLQKLGVEIDDAYRFRLKLGNDLGEETVSAWLDLT